MKEVAQLDAYRSPSKSGDDQPAANCCSYTPRLPDTMRELLDTLDQVDELCRHERMLTLAASGAEQRLIRWWFTEFVRQGAGHPPTSWPDFIHRADV